MVLIRFFEWVLVSTALVFLLQNDFARCFRSCACDEIVCFYQDAHCRRFTILYFPAENPFPNLLRILLFATNFCRSHRHGRDTGFPVPPAQIPACSIPALGSSVSTRFRHQTKHQPDIAIPRREVGLHVPICKSEQVSFAGFVPLSTPSPCERLSRSQSTMG